MGGIEKLQNETIITFVLFILKPISALSCYIVCTEHLKILKSAHVPQVITSRSSTGGETRERASESERQEILPLFLHHYLRSEASQESLFHFFLIQHEF